MCIARADQCSFGLRGPEGGLHQKATGFVTNCLRMAQVLSQRCDGSHQHEVIIGGQKSRRAQQYPARMIGAILKCHSHSEHLGIEVKVKEVNTLLEEIYNLDYVINEHFKQISDPGQVHGSEHRQREEPRLIVNNEMYYMRFLQVNWTRWKMRSWSREKNSKNQDENCRLGTDSAWLGLYDEHMKVSGTLTEIAF